MYMKMLKAAVKKIRGLALPSVGRTRMHVEGLGSGDDFDLPEGYAPDVDRDREVAEARLATNSKELVEITKRWSKSYGAVPDEVKRKLKELHLHSCTRTLGVDEVHPGEYDSVILRSPGLRPGHWKVINKGGKFDSSVEAVFPNFMVADPAPPPPDALEEGTTDEGSSGVFTEASFAKEASEDAGLDPEEALYESLAAPEPGTYEGCPRLIVRALPGPEGLQDRVLKVLLPLAARVDSIQEKDKERAVEADERRKKKEEFEGKKNIKKRSGYYY